MLKYIELKSGYSDNGPAWIARTTASKTGGTVYFNGMALKKIKGGGISGNYCNLESGDEYWISGIKKQGLKRHQFGSGAVNIEKSAVDEFLRITENDTLNARDFHVCADLPYTHGGQFVDFENA